LRETGFGTDIKSLAHFMPPYFTHRKAHIDSNKRFSPHG
jgi:hypothetical protein